MRMDVEFMPLGQIYYNWKKHRFGFMESSHKRGMGKAVPYLFF